MEAVLFAFFGSRDFMTGDVEAGFDEFFFKVAVLPDGPDGENPAGLESLFGEMKSV